MMAYELLAGAHEMDRHFATTPLETNLPARLGLLDVWYRNFHGFGSRSIAPSGSKTITKSFILGKDSQTEDGEVPFDHETHASKMYSPDGKSTIACIECHHTDQPKSALKPPLSTSERDVVLTLASWQASSQKVNECRSCHFQSGAIPEGKTFDEFYERISESMFAEQRLGPQRQRQWFDMTRALFRFHRLVVPMREVCGSLVRREHARDVAVDERRALADR